MLAIICTSMVFPIAILSDCMMNIINFALYFQDKRLKMYVKMYDENWELIAAQFTDRSDVQCQQRWTKVVNPELVKGPWTKEVGIDIPK